MRSLQALRMRETLCSTSAGRELSVKGGGAACCKLRTRALQTWDGPHTVFAHGSGGPWPPPPLGPCWPEVPPARRRAVRTAPVPGRRSDGIPGLLCSWQAGTQTAGACLSWPTCTPFTEASGTASPDQCGSWPLRATHRISLPSHPPWTGQLEGLQRRFQQYICRACGPQQRAGQRGCLCASQREPSPGAHRDVHTSGAGR